MVNVVVRINDGGAVLHGIATIIRALHGSMNIVGEKIRALGPIRNWLHSPGVISLGATDTSRWLR